MDNGHINNGIMVSNKCYCDVIVIVYFYSHHKTLMSQINRTGPLACLVLSSVRLLERVRVFGLELYKVKYKTLSSQNKCIIFN